MIRPTLPLALTVALGACVSTPPLKQAVVAPPALSRTGGLERVMGQSAASLTGLFGSADQDVTEASARRLQFSSGICILDAYLYPPAKGREPVVTYVDARQPNGQSIDRASCVAAMVRRREAR